MKPSPSSIPSESLEKLLSNKVTPARPSAGFSGRVMDRLQPADELPARNGFPSWSVAIAASVVAGLVVTALMFQGTRGNDPDQIVEAVPPTLDAGVGPGETVVLPKIDAGMWTGFAIEEGLANESDALRKDAVRFGDFLARSIPSLPVRDEGIDS